MYLENRCEYAFPRKRLRQALRRLLNSEAEALMSLPLFAEYEAVLGRLETQRRCPLTAMEQTQLLDAFLSRTRLVVGHRCARAAQPRLSVVGVGQCSTLIGTIHESY